MWQRQWQWQWHPGRSAYLTRRVDYFSRKVLTFVFDHLAEGILDGWIVTLYKMAFHKLYREGRLAFGRGQHQILRTGSKGSRELTHRSTAYNRHFPLLRWCGHSLLLTRRRKVVIKPRNQEQGSPGNLCAITSKVDKEILEATQGTFT